MTHRKIVNLTPSVIYAVAGLPLFIHMTVAVLGAILLLITALFLAGQVKVQHVIILLFLQSLCVQSCLDFLLTMISCC